MLANMLVVRLGGRCSVGAVTARQRCSIASRNAELGEWAVARQTIAHPRHLFNELLSLGDDGFRCAFLGEGVALTVEAVDDLGKDRRPALYRGIICHTALREIHKQMLIWTHLPLSTAL